MTAVATVQALERLARPLRARSRAGWAAGAVGLAALVLGSAAWLARLSVLTAPWWVLAAWAVARPSAHGQAMMSTDTNTTVAYTSAGAGPMSNQITKAAMARAITTGTNTAAMRSASRWTGARLPCASSTSRTICASAVSRPTRVASTTIAPVVLSVAPTTSSPSTFSTGIGSPVSMDSSTAVRPVRTTPSTATFSPGRTRNRSPTATSAAGTSTSVPSRKTRAVLGVRSSSRRIASDMRPLARASSRRPRRMSAMMDETAS